MGEAPGWMCELVDSWLEGRVGSGWGLEWLQLGMPPPAHRHQQPLILATPPDMQAIIRFRTI